MGVASGRGILATVICPLNSVAESILDDIFDHAKSRATTYSRDEGLTICTVFTLMRLLLT